MTVKLIINGTLPNLNDYIAAERKHRQQAAKMKAQAEQIVRFSIRRQARKRKFTAPVTMRYRWYEPNKRRDKDNISSFGRKVIQDALVKEKVLENDGWAYIDGFSDEFFVDKKNPRIEVDIQDRSTS